MMEASPPWRLAAVIALAATLAGPVLPGLAGARVLAHAQLVASSPGAGVVVPESPDEIRLVFSEPLEAHVTSMDVRAQDGSTSLERVGEIDAEDPFALVLAEPELPDGVYLIFWRTLSSADGHTAEGFFTFGVGDVAEADAAGHGAVTVTHQETDPVAVVGRWLTYFGLLLALGVAVFHRAVIRDRSMPLTLIRLLAAGLAISALATFVVALAAALETGSVTEYLFASRNGGLQLARAAVAAAGAVILLLVPARLSGWVAIGSGLAGIVLLVVAGHASALPTPVPVVAGAVHVAAAAVWIGGVVSLLGLRLRPQLLVGGRPPGMRSLVPRFSALALASIGLVALTGVYSAWAQTGVLLDPSTEYGRTLLMKSGLAVGAMALGSLNYFDGGRMLGWLGGFRSRVGVESMVIGAVLLMTAALATTPPTEEARGVEIEPIPDAFGEVAPGMSMQVVPGRPGVNRVVVTTADTMVTLDFELALDRLDTGSTTRVPLTPEGMAAMNHSAGMDHSVMDLGADGTVDWIADAVVLPAGSAWDTSVRAISDAGTELSRQRFAFELSETRITEGETSSLINPALGVAAMLVLGGALGLGLGLGGMALPRCEAAASRLALVGGGVVAIALGGLIGLTRLVG